MLDGRLVSYERTLPLRLHDRFSSSMILMLMLMLMTVSAAAVADVVVRPSTPSYSLR